jgi:hypothetical protein
MSTRRLEKTITHGAVALASRGQKVPNFESDISDSLGGAKVENLATSAPVRDEARRAFTRETKLSRISALG